MRVNDYKSLIGIFELSRGFYYLLHWVFIFYLSNAMP